VRNAVSASSLVVESSISAAFNTFLLSVDGVEDESRSAF
jgi:hypothetical protein